jgi:hypothetical protein
MLDIKFPLTITVPDGRTVVAEDREELANLAELFKVEKFVTPEGVMVHGDMNMFVSSIGGLIVLNDVAALLRDLAHYAPCSIELGPYRFQSYKFDLSIVVEMIGYLADEDDTYNHGHFLSICSMSNLFQ